MYPIAILLTFLFTVASPTPLLSHSLARVVPAFTVFDRPAATFTIGPIPIPTGWRHTHRPPPAHSTHPFDIGPLYRTDQPLDDIDYARNTARAANDGNNVAVPSNTKDIVLIAPKRKILLPPPPMTNVFICQALCSMYGAEPCGPCEDVSNSPSATLPPPNAERTDTLSRRLATTPQDRAWLPLWRCLMQCIENRASRCERCNDYWSFYQKSLPPDAYQDPGMESYIEMTRCLVSCGRGKYGPACDRCERLWSVWEEKLSLYVGPRDLKAVGGKAKSKRFREDILGLTLYGCLKGCDPEKPESPREICDRCRKMVSMFPPVYLHNWAIERPIIQVEQYNPNSSGPGGDDDYD